MSRSNSVPGWDGNGKRESVLYRGMISAVAVELAGFRWKGFLDEGGVLKASVPFPRMSFTLYEVTGGVGVRREDFSAG